MEEENGSPVEDGMNHVLSLGSTSRDLQTTYLIISLVLSVGCGLLLILLVWKKEYLRKPSHYLRCNLAVDDIIFTGCLIPIRINALFRQDTRGGQVWCAAEGLLGPVCFMSMYGTYLMMAVDLYYFVCDPLHYHDKVTTKRVILGIFAFRAFSIFFGIAFAAFVGLPKYSWRCEMVMDPSNSVLAILLCLGVLFSLLVALSILIIYCRVFKEARRQQERDENRDLWVFQIKAFKMMVPHVIVLTVSTTTASFYAAMLLAMVREEQMSQRALIIAERVTILLYLTLSSVANPLIYSFRLPELRRACKELCGWPNNPPVVPARLHGQDGMGMATIIGPGHDAPATELAPAQTSAQGLIMQPTAESVPTNQAQTQTTQVDMTSGLPPRPGHRGRETASGRPLAWEAGTSQCNEGQP
ncbi:PREDICTED: G-protein coupled receptor 161-like [Branchiostoma belcheri]|uniref:G-protein coupled receptor 161-like n=1 Tax=Branchiostoma belcheri TaxID=7741 RepID=A0A6P4YIK0_BRABE|nr:PREDICTED: G-protein coupled receptor 161-like [Branchiostoma belcheri]